MDRDSEQDRDQAGEDVHRGGIDLKMSGKEGSAVVRSSLASKVQLLTYFTKTMDTVGYAYEEQKGVI